MQNAPKDAIYVWVNSRLDYPKRLAESIGRNDLQIVTPYWFDSEKWRGRKFSEIIVDHAATLTTKQFLILASIRFRIKKP